MNKEVKEYLVSLGFKKTDVNFVDYYLLDDFICFYFSSVYYFKLNTERNYKFSNPDYKEFISYVNVVIRKRKIEILLNNG